MSTFLAPFYGNEGSLYITNSIIINHLYSETQIINLANKENYLKLIKGLEFFYHRMGWVVPLNTSGLPGHFGVPSEVSKTWHKKWAPIVAVSKQKLFKNLHCLLKRVVTIMHFDLWNRRDDAIILQNVKTKNAPPFIMPLLFLLLAHYHNSDFCADCVRVTEMGFYLCSSACWILA